MRTPLCCFASAAMAFMPVTAQAQTTYVPGIFTWSHTEVLAGTAAPSSMSPGVIEPGEGVRFALRLSFSPPVGTTVAYMGGTGPGTGELTAWLGSIFDFIGDSGAEGIFALLEAPPLMGASLQTLSTSSVAVSVGQSPLNPVGVFNTSSTFEPFVSFTWTPQSYEPRTVSFLSRGPLAQFIDRVLIRYGTGPTGLPLYVAPITPTNHTIGIEPQTDPIRIVPSPPGVLAFAAIATLLSGRRRGER